MREFSKRFVYLFEILIDMEALLTTQRTEIDELNRLIGNYGKDGAGRKNERYLLDKVNTFGELFRVIEENDQAIQNLRAPEHEKQPYFMNKTFEALTKLYNDTIRDIQARLEVIKVGKASAATLTPGRATNLANLSKSSTAGAVKNNSVASVAESSIGNEDQTLDDGANDLGNDDISSQRDEGSQVGDEGDGSVLMMLYNDVMDMLATARELTNESSLGLITAHAANLDSMWMEFRGVFYQEKAAKKRIPFNFAVLLNKYLFVSGKLNDLKRKPTPQPQNCEQASSIQFNLPKLQLPEFHGKLNDWKRFIALFDRMVHNNPKIDHGIKIEYLKTCVKGQAAKIINHIDPNPDNYITCYDLLRKRFDNKRELLGALIDNVLQLPKIKSENADMLKTMHDTVYESIMSIKNIEVSTENWDPLLCHMLTRKLDSATLIHYECQLQDVREPQSLISFLSYLENRFMALQSANIKQDYNGNYNGNHNHNNNYNKHEKFDQNKQLKCVFCKGDHFVTKCDGFLKKNVAQRIDWAREKRCCLNCFGTHKTFDCKSKFSCRTCSKRHSTILHLDRKNNEKNIKANVAQTTEISVIENHEEVININSNVARQNIGSVLLATILLGVFDKNGSRVLLRALLDQGSQSAFISETAAQTLKFGRKNINAIISGIGDKEQRAIHSVQLTLFPRFESNYILNCDAIVLPKLTKITDNTRLKTDIDFVNNLTLADPSFLNGGEIDIILGASEYAQIIKMGLMKGEKNVIAQNTEFGWVVSGAFGTGPCVRVLSFVTNIELQQSLQRFFRADEFDNAVNSEMSEEEKYCEEHFVKTIQRDEEGRFVVTLPLKNRSLYPDLGDSRKCAIATLFQLEKRFAKNPKLGEEYSKFIREGIELGHIEEVPYERNKQIHYMPHHCVFKDSTTTALRVVYNGSQKTSNFKSLNEQLAIGRVQQRDIFALLIRFRMFRYVFTADVEKMYKQILLNESQLDLHRFLYRFSPNDPMRDFRLKTVTFGTANAPYIAIRTLGELAKLNGEKYPMAAKMITSNMYMDDVLGGAHSLDEMYQTYDELRAVFASARFNLRKWCSNEQTFLDRIPETDLEVRALVSYVKTLGISWFAKNDVFSYNIAVPIESHPTTKRHLTSEIAMLFDPLGWITPVVLRARNIIQNLWKETKDWDVPVDNSHVMAWKKIKHELHLLSSLQIPRWINYTPHHVMEIHGFCDASEVGFAAVVYLKNVTKKSVHLLAAKSKVAPLKDAKNEDNVTIPRLELCGAHLLAKLVKSILDTLETDFHRVCLWTDSKIVLGWLNGDPDRYKKFIAGKIRTINKLTDKTNWRHVAGEQNPADCASRGILPSELVHHSLWWHGPEFLNSEEIELPTNNGFETDLGERSNRVTVSTASVFNNELRNAKTFDELKKLMAIEIRAANANNDGVVKGDDFSTDELLAAYKEIIRRVQCETFANEINALNTGKYLPKSNRYVALSPFIDDEGILRVGGRLRNADISYDAKHQILLPGGHPITTLIIRHCHELCLHGGPKLTESIIRQNYWICTSQRTIKSVLKQCVNCFRVNPKPMQQYMGDLPGNRVNAVQKPFHNTAVDYTGAVLVKMSNGRGCKTQKAYVAIFVCMATKAIHIEAVTDMTADAFIAAFRRFVARRGVIGALYSDNGTNFVRANKILQEHNKNIDENEYNAAVCHELSKGGTHWFFSPAGAPHFNGLAEAAVKSVKLHLKKTMGESKLSYEELSTLLAQIEACVNSRPLCALSTDPNDVNVLTPSHFLIGQSAILPPDRNHLEEKITWLSRWQRVQQMSQYFWKRWQADYLNQLQTRTKWQHGRDSPRVNDVVLILEENLPPARWQTGTIVSIHPGGDGHTRVVSLKVGDSIIKRPVTKICQFPKDDAGDSILANHSKTSNATGSFSAGAATDVRYGHKSWRILPIVAALLTIFTTGGRSYPMNGSTPFEISIFEKPPGLYFEYKSDAFVAMSRWNLIAAIDLRKFHDMFEHFDERMKILRSTCTKRFDDDEFCNEWIDVLDAKINQLDDRFNLITSNQARKKRSVLDFVGNMAGDVFGIMDSRSKKKYKSDIRELKANDEHLLDLIKNQTSLVEKTLDILQINDDELKRRGEQFANFTKKIDKTMDEYAAASFFSDTVTHMLQEISEFNDRINVLLETVFDSRKHHINHNLFPPKQLASEIKVISEHVRNKYVVPDGNHVYNLISIVPHITRQQILFHVSIPLLQMDGFKIYRIVSVPFTAENETWIIHTENEFLITSEDRTRYQFLSEIDLGQCAQYGDHLVCWGPYHYKTARVSSCEWNIFNEISNENCVTNRFYGSNAWCNVGENNWLFYAGEKSDLTFICNDGVFRRQVQGSGLLRFDQNCTVRNFDLEINGKKSFHGRQIEFLIPKIGKYHDHTKKWQNTMNLSNWNASDMNNLREIIRGVRSNSSLPFGLESHDLHHYSISYFTMAMLICFVYIVWKKSSAFMYNMGHAITNEIPMPEIANSAGIEGADVAIE